MSRIAHRHDREPLDRRRQQLAALDAALDRDAFAAATAAERWETMRRVGLVAVAVARFALRRSRGGA